MELKAGTTLGSYKIEALNGKGGMGEVYRARDTGLDRSVAIKVLPQSFAANPERVARFEREARLLATLSHQNIAGIYRLEKKTASVIWCWNWWKAKRSRNTWKRPRYRSKKRYESAVKLPTQCPPHMSRASFIET